MLALPTLVAGTLLAFCHAYVPPATPQLFSLASCPVACPCIPRTRSRAVGGTLEASKRSGGGERRDRSSKGRVVRIALEEMYEGVELQGIIRSVKDFGVKTLMGPRTHSQPKHIQTHTIFLFSVRSTKLKGERAGLCRRWLNDRRSASRERHAATTSSVQWQQTLCFCV